MATYFINVYIYIFCQIVYKRKIFISVMNAVLTYIKKKEQDKNYQVLADGAEIPVVSKVDGDIMGKAVSKCTEGQLLMMYNKKRDYRYRITSTCAHVMLTCT